jgi:hypothetical protein
MRSKDNTIPVAVRSKTVAHGGGGGGGSNTPSPRNSEFLTKLSRIPSKKVKHSRYRPELA